MRYGLLGTVGLSAVGITTGLAAAGALIGGGMVAGIGVLAAPVAGLAVAGYAFANARKKAKVKELQGQVLAKAWRKHNEITAALLHKDQLSAKVLAELEARIALLQQIIEGLEQKRS